MWEIQPQNKKNLLFLLKTSIIPLYYIIKEDTKMKKFWKKYRVWIIILIVVAVMAAAGAMSKAMDPHAGHDHANNPHSDHA